jgi:predicted membrane channel-forming protein YqfA (hemolysin III family)
MGIGVSIFLMAVGAILAFAVDVSADGINLDTVGVILIILGLVGILASLVWWDEWTPRRRLAYEDDGEIVVVRRPRVVAIDDVDDGVVDVTENRPEVERRRVTTRRTTHGGF